jgi:hypothetical protein
VEVDADLSAVDVQRTGRDSRWELGRKERLAAEAALEIFRFERPARQQHPFDARAHCPLRGKTAGCDFRNTLVLQMNFA